MKGFDARCSACDDCQVVWVAWEHEEGDTIKIAHVGQSGACGAYCEHTLVRALNGLSHIDKWGPPGEQNTQTSPYTTAADGGAPE